MTRIQLAQLESQSGDETSLNPLESTFYVFMVTKEATLCGGAVGVSKVDSSVKVSFVIASGASAPRGDP
ncbi:hypothetical protein [Helicobacter canis]|uniref:hypothetical protein n=1 Tax=Helicobacter canis TaxID=29419 RepID=UPI000E0F6292|nr:hypothetical protein [Helicobacter canis]